MYLNLYSQGHTEILSVFWETFQIRDISKVHNTLEPLELYVPMKSGYNLKLILSPVFCNLHRHTLL